MSLSGGTKLSIARVGVAKLKSIARSLIAETIVRAVSIIAIVLNLESSRPIYLPKT